MPLWDVLMWSLAVCALLCCFFALGRMDQNVPPSSSGPRHRVPVLVQQTPNCKQVSKGEAECGRVLRLLFATHAWQQNVRPKWLLNAYPGRQSKPQPMELDWFCESLGLAVEFNGRQHYKVVPFFHGSDPEVARRRFYGQQMRDAAKHRLCQEHQIDLVVVRWNCPDIEHFLRFHPSIIAKRQQFL